MTTKSIRVEIDYSATFIKYNKNPITMHVAVWQKLREAGIPLADSPIELPGCVTSGVFSMWNFYRDGRRFCIYEWTPTAVEEDEL